MFLLFTIQNNGNVIDIKAIPCEHCVISVLNLDPSFEVIPIEKEKKKNGKWIGLGLSRQLGGKTSMGGNYPWF